VVRILLTYSYSYPEAEARQHRSSDFRRSETFSAFEIRRRNGAAAPFLHFLWKTEKRSPRIERVSAISAVRYRIDESLEIRAKIRAEEEKGDKIGTGDARDKNRLLAENVRSRLFVRLLASRKRVHGYQRIRFVSRVSLARREMYLDVD